MDEHDSAFDGAMEYDEEDGRSLLGEDFDAGSDGKGDVSCHYTKSILVPQTSRMQLYNGNMMFF